MRQRYYNPEIKRFVNQDILTGSISNSQSLNRYSYVQGNPVSYTDPFGLSPLNGLFSGTMLIHSVCELLGWIPGPVGAIANVVDGLVYLFVDKDYKNAFYSLGTAVTFGTGKIVAAVGKGSKTALNIQRGCNAIGNGINFLQSAEGTVQMGGMMIDKYIVQGQPFDSSTAMEFLFLGANMFGATKSGTALATDVMDFGRMVKGSRNAKNTGSGTSTDNYVYRALNQKDYERYTNGLGLEAKNPDGSWSLKEHLVDGSGKLSWVNDPYISTTSDFSVAKGFDQSGSGYGVVKIDMNKVTSASYKGYEMYPRLNGKEGLPYHYSVWQQETSVYQSIPFEAIVDYFN